MRWCTASAQCTVHQQYRPLFLQLPNGTTQLNPPPAPNSLWPSKGHPMTAVLLALYRCPRRQYYLRNYLRRGFHCLVAEDAESGRVLGTMAMSLARPQVGPPFLTATPALGPESAALGSKLAALGSHCSLPVCTTHQCQGRAGCTFPLMSLYFILGCSERPPELC